MIALNASFCLSSREISDQTLENALDWLQNNRKK